jgi:hypothetical protein
VFLSCVFELFRRNELRRAAFSRVDLFDRLSSWNGSCDGRNLSSLSSLFCALQLGVHSDASSVDE